MLNAKRFLGLTTLLFLFSLAFATATVEFSVESSNANPRVGDSFNLLVKLNIPAAEEIKSAEFTLTPGAGATLRSGTSGALLGGAPSLNVIAGNALQYAEGTTGAAVSGNARLLVTIPVTAGAVGDVTFTFSSLKAAKGRSTRTTSSTPLTITIGAAAAADPCAGIVCLNGGSCVAGACNCVGGYSGATCENAPVVAATCNDGIQNQAETGVDCGGPCAACVVAPTCYDSIQNQAETGVDCGGPCAACVVAPTCNDGVQNQAETGVDCGGPCAACVVAPTCNDNIQNQAETGIDCGGPCAACLPATKKSQLKAEIESIPVPEQDNWTINLINSIAQILKRLFPN